MSAATAYLENLNPEQRRAVEHGAVEPGPFAPLLVIAGAGSGKTTVMAARVVWLVGTGQVAPEQVLGLTFTNKAAGELAERVRRHSSRRVSPTPTSSTRTTRRANP